MTDVEECFETLIMLIVKVYAEIVKQSILKRTNRLSWRFPASRAFFSSYAWGRKNICDRGYKKCTPAVRQQLTRCTLYRNRDREQKDHGPSSSPPLNSFSTLWAPLRLNKHHPPAFFFYSQPYTFYSSIDHISLVAVSGEACIYAASSSKVNKKTKRIQI